MDESLKQKIAALRDTRVKVAVQGRALALRELDARELKARCEESLRAGGEGRVALNKTDADRAAKLHPDYLAHEHQTAQLAYEREHVFPPAERHRFEVHALLPALP